MAGSRRVSMLISEVLLYLLPRLYDVYSFVQPTGATSVMEFNVVQTYVALRFSNIACHSKSRRL